MTRAILTSKPIADTDGGRLYAISCSHGTTTALVREPHAREDGQVAVVQGHLTSYRCTCAAAVFQDEAEGTSIVEALLTEHRPD